MLFQATHKTPVGELFLVSDEHILLAAGFRNFKDLFARMDSADQKREVKSMKNIPIITDLIKDYFDGDLTALGEIKCDNQEQNFLKKYGKPCARFRLARPGLTQI